MLAASHLLDLVRNPWRGRELVRRTFEARPERHPPERVAARHARVIEALRRRIERERERLSREVFGHLSKSGETRFQMGAEDLAFNRIPPKDRVAAGPRRFHRPPRPSGVRRTLPIGGDR